MISVLAYFLLSPQCPWPKGTQNKLLCLACRLVLFVFRLVLFVSRSVLFVFNRDFDFGQDPGGLPDAILFEGLLESTLPSRDILVPPPAFEIECASNLRNTAKVTL